MGVLVVPAESAQDAADPSSRAGANIVFNDAPALIDYAVRRAGAHVF